MKKTRVIFVFLDGVGIGKNDPEVNPFIRSPMQRLRSVFGGNYPTLRSPRYASQTASFVPLNATLGVLGLPQSGTGQTSLLTGLNAPKFVGKHFGPFPYSTLRPLLEEKNIYRTLQRVKKTVFYANAFPQQFFTHLEAHPTRIAATTMAWRLCGFKLNDADDLHAERALSANITADGWKKLGYPNIEPITPHHAGKRLVRISNHYDLTVFDYFQTDYVGHSQSFEKAAAVLGKLDQFFDGIVGSMNHATTTLVVTSDHGNLEDLSTKSHTRNSVPLFAIGAQHTYFSERMKNLTHLAPAIVEFLL